MNTRLEQAYARGRSQTRFRGGVLDNARGTPMVKGHNNNGQPFDISTACYTRPIFAEYDDAVLNGRKKKIIVKAGVKTLKSYILELCGLDHVNNRQGDVAIFFGSGESADITATTRILDHYRSNERFAKKLETLRTRFDETNGAIKFPEKTFFILPANLAQTQQKNLAFAGIQDAFVTGKSGMIKQIIDRQTQYAENYIAFFESQGGVKGDDFDKEYEETDQRELHVICPLCKQKHIWNWKAFDLQHMTRPPDFKIERLRGRPAGFHFRPFEHRQNLTSQQLEEDFHEQLIMDNTHFECYHCGGIWRDLPEVRTALDESSFYIPFRPDALKHEVGFNIPQWINRRIPWNEIMLKKVRASATSRESGNFKPLEIWWQKQAGRTWDPDIPARSRMLAVTIGSYETDPAKHRFGEDFHCRQMTVDCGKRIGAAKAEPVIGKLFYEIREVAKTGSSCQLARGMVQSWELLDAQRRFWQVPNLRVGVDCAWMPSQVEENAVKCFELVPPNSKIQIPATWRLLLGSDNKRMTINNKGVTFIRTMLPGVRTAHDKNGKLWRMSLLRVSWSNLHFEQLFESIIRDTVAAKWEVLDQSKLIIVDENLKPSEKLTRTYIEEWETDRGAKFLSWQNQLNSRYLSEKTGRFEDYEKQNRPTEGRDCGLMHLVLCAMDGLLGHAIS